MTAAACCSWEECRTDVLRALDQDYGVDVRLEQAPRKRLVYDKRFSKAAAIGGASWRRPTVFHGVAIRRDIPREFYGGEGEEAPRL